MHHMQFALDRNSVRTIDQDGHLHVAASIITSACVSLYNGSEINGAQSLGLNPNQRYSLLRDPDALQRAAPTLQGKPLLITHKPQLAASHDHKLTVGSIINPRWRAPNIVAELVVWDAKAIESIIDGTERGLSAGYYYRAVMEPGTFEGKAYSGRMVDIVFNHVALVDEPRVAAAFVGDRKPQNLQQRKNLIVMDAAEIDKNDDVFTQICKFLDDKISPDDMTSLVTLWKNANGIAQDDVDENGMPKNGIERQAMDARRRSSAHAAFERKFPDIARIRRV
jgi:hypothetical protein